MLKMIRDQLSQSIIFDDGDVGGEKFGMIWFWTSWNYWENFLGESGVGGGGGGATLAGVL